MQADLSLWLPRQGHFPKDNAIPTPHQGGHSLGLQGTVVGLYNCPRGVPTCFRPLPSFWILSPTSSPEGFRHPPRHTPTHRHLHTLPWSQSADSAERADPPSQPLPWPGRFLPRFLARGRGVGRGGAAGCRRRAPSSLAPAAMMGVGGRGACRKKSGCPDKLIGAFILPFA